MLENRHAYLRRKKGQNKAPLCLHDTENVASINFFPHKAKLT